eukprot:167293-Chlamydomonas_euryale.AAC.1
MHISARLPTTFLPNRHIRTPYQADRITSPAKLTPPHSLTALESAAERQQANVLARPPPTQVYPRWNGEVYICGCGGSDYVSGARLRAGGDCEHQSE